MILLYIQYWLDAIGKSRLLPWKETWSANVTGTWLSSCYPSSSVSHVSHKNPDWVSRLTFYKNILYCSKIAILTSSANNILSSENQTLRVLTHIFRHLPVRHWVPSSLLCSLGCLVYLTSSRQQVKNFVPANWNSLVVISAVLFQAPICKQQRCWRMCEPCTVASSCGNDIFSLTLIYVWQLTTISTSTTT